MPEAYIGLGSNLGSQSRGIHKTPRDQINDAIETMSKNPDISLIAISSYYQTSAIGPGEQPDYINAAIKIKTNLDPYLLLDILQIIENQQGRIRKERWGARTLDLDILVYDQCTENTQKLILPHPRMHERAFVLAPLADISPELIIADHGMVNDLLANCSMQGIVRLTN